MIRLLSSDDTPAKLDAVETATLIDAIQRRFRGFGIVEDPEATSADEFRVIEAFTVEQYRVGRGIEVSILEDRRDGSIVVVVSSAVWDSFAGSVLDDVKGAIADALPNFRIRVDRHVAPDLR